MQIWHFDGCWLNCSCHFPRDLPSRPSGHTPKWACDMRWFPQWPHKRCPTGCRNRASNMATWNICMLKRTWNIISNLPANSAFLPWQFDMTVLTLIHDRRRTNNAKHKAHWLPTSKITYVLPLPPLTSLELFEVWAPFFALLGRYSNINHILCGKRTHIDCIDLCPCHTMRCSLCFTQLRQQTCCFMQGTQKILW